MVHKPNAPMKRRERNLVATPITNPEHLKRVVDRYRRGPGHGNCIDWNMAAIELNSTADLVKRQWSYHRDRARKKELAARCRTVVEQLRRYQKNGCLPPPPNLTTTELASWGECTFDAILEKSATPPLPESTLGACGIPIADALRWRPATGQDIEDEFPDAYTELVKGKAVFNAPAYTFEFVD